MVYCFMCNRGKPVAQKLELVDKEEQAFLVDIKIGDKTLKTPVCEKHKSTKEMKNSF